MEQFPTHFRKPDQGATQNTEDNVIVNNFGDGYEQRISQGINNQKIILELTWVDYTENILEMYNWLTIRKNRTTFLYQYFTEKEELIFLCTQADKNDDGVLSTLKVKFEQRFDII